MTKALHGDGPWYDDGVANAVVAAFLNDIRSWMPDMVDGAAGGTWAPSSALQVADIAIGYLAPLVAAVGGYISFEPAEIADAADQTIDPADGVFQPLADPGALRNHQMAAAGNAGSIVVLKTSPTCGFVIDVRRSGFAGNYIVRFNGAYGAAVLYDDGSDWRLLHNCGNTLVGVDA